MKKPHFRYNVLAAHAAILSPRDNMNNTLQVILRRRSLRVYADQPLQPLHRNAILQAALRAPTAGNMMLYSIIEVTDQALKDQLAVTCDNQPFLAKAPLVLLFLADYQRWEDYYTACGVDELCALKGMQRRHPQEGDLFLACCDALIAAQTAVLAADALGLGSCYIGDIMEQYQVHKDLLGLPQYVFPVCMLVFGYPTQQQIDRPFTPRFDEKFIVFKNRYRQLSRDEFTEMFAERQSRLPAGWVKEGVTTVGQATYLRKFSADFSVELRRSVREWLKQWAE